MSSVAQEDRKQRIGVAIGIIAYTIIIGTICQLKYGQFGYTDFDLAAHAQSLHSILGGRLDCSVLGVPFLGNHLVLVLYPIALFATLLPAAPLLLWIQAATLALGAWPLYRLAAGRLPATWAALLSAIYLLYPPLLYMNLYEFHPIALASTGLLYALLYLHEDRFVPFAACVLLAMCCQENVALIAGGLGIYAWALRKRGRWVWTPLAVGAVAFILSVAIILPRLNPGIIGFNAIYGQFGQSLPAAALNILRHPLRAVAFALQPSKRAFLVVLLIPLGFTPLLGPRAWIAVLPILAQRLLSNRPSESSIEYHYQAEFIPFIFLSAIEGIRLLRCRWPGRGRVIATVLIIAAAGSIGLSGVGPALLQATHTDLARHAIKARHRVLREIPADAVLIAPFRYLPQLADVDQLHSLHHIYFGRYTLSPVEYKVPPEVDFILLDSFDPLTFGPDGFYTPSGHQRLQRLLDSARWSISFNEDSFVLLCRTTGPSELPSLTSFATNTVLNADASVAGMPLQSARMEATATPNRYRLTTTWLCSGPTTDFLATVTITDGNGKTCRRRIAPGHRAWPPHSWPHDRLVTDQQYLHLPTAPLAPFELQVEIQPVLPRS